MPDRVPQTRVAIPTTGLVMLGTVLLMLAFVASYVSVLHSPRSHELAVGVLSTRPATAQLTRDIEQSAPSLAVDTYASTDDIRKALQDSTIYAGLVPGPGTRTDLVYVASATDPAGSADVLGELRGTEQERGQTLEVIDIAPLPDTDPRGLASGDLVVGWLVCGLLSAGALGWQRGNRPLRVRAALLRIVALAGRAVVGGAASIAYLDQVQHLTAGPELQLMGLGALVIAASALSAAGVLSVLGMLGGALTLLAYVLVGNPASSSLLPLIWRTAGAYLPQAAGTDALRSMLYVESTALLRPLSVLGAYAGAGVLVLLTSSAVDSHRRRLQMARIDDAVAMAMELDKAAGADDGLSVIGWQGTTLVLPDGDTVLASREQNDRSTWSEDSQMVGTQGDM